MAEFFSGYIWPLIIMDVFGRDRHRGVASVAPDNYLMPINNISSLFCISDTGTSYPDWVSS